MNIYNIIFIGLLALTSIANTLNKSDIIFSDTFKGDSEKELTEYEAKFKISERNSKKAEIHPPKKNS